MTPLAAFVLTLLALPVPAQLQPSGPGGPFPVEPGSGRPARLPDVHPGVPPDLAALSSTTAEPSDLLILTGNGFGGGQGGTSQVLIDGLSAIVTQWTDSEIRAYVPEASTPGTVPVVVGTAAGWSNALPLTVTGRESAGRLKWSFQTSSYLPSQFIAVGPDGTVYTSDAWRFYALDPDGGLKWIVEGAGGGRPISFGADGTIYTGGADALIYAINPDGSVRWTVPAPIGLGLLAGPNVGPDGNIYAVQDSGSGGGGLGTFSVDPDGDLRFSQVHFFSFVGGNSEITFGDGQFYGSWEFTASGPATVHTFDMANGDVLWTAADIGVSASGYPILDPTGRLMLAWGQVGLVAVTPDAEPD